MYAHGHSIVYNNVLTTTKPVAVLYVIATCGALFFSGFKDLVILPAQYGGFHHRHAHHVLCVYIGVVRVCCRGERRDLFLFPSQSCRPVKYLLAV